jgi:hypothetical protein
MSGQGYGLNLPIVERLAGEITAVRNDLVDQGAARADIDESETGDAEIFAAIRTFDQNWHDGRLRVIDNLSRTEDVLTSVLGNYVTTEGRLSEQFDGGAS